MVKRKDPGPPRAADVERDDPRGVEWQGIADERWAAAVRAAGAVGPDADPINYYEPVPLPDFVELKPAHIGREVLGAYVYDRETNRIHSIEHATEGCRIDAIAAATFIHFWAEVRATAPDAIPCPRCFA